MLPLASKKDKCLNLGLLLPSHNFKVNILPRNYFQKLFLFELCLRYRRAAKLVKAESLLLLEDWREAGEEVGGH